MLNRGDPYCYVRVLNRWIKAMEGDRDEKRKMLNPMDRLFDEWLRDAIKPCYRISLNRFDGVDFDLFVDLCIIKLLTYAKNYPQRFTKSTFDNKRLQKLVKRISVCKRIDTSRRFKSRHFADIDIYATLMDDGFARQLPDNLLECQSHWWIDLYPLFEREARKINQTMRQFTTTLRGQKRMREVLAALLIYARSLNEKLLFPAYMILFLILLRRRTHLSKKLLGYLSLQFPKIDSNVINSRLGLIRRQFEAFLEKGDLLDWANRVVLRVFGLKLGSV